MRHHWEEAMELWRAEWEVLTAPWLFSATESLSWSPAHSLFLTFPRSSLSLLNSLMNLLLFRLNGIDIPVTEPNFFNISQEADCEGRESYICFFLNQSTTTKKAKPNSWTKNLCSLPQIIFKSGKMNEIRCHTSLHIYTQSPLRAGTPRLLNLGFLLHNRCDNRGEKNP